MRRKEKNHNEELKLQQDKEHMHKNLNFIYVQKVLEENHTLIIPLLKVKDTDSKLNYLAVPPIKNLDSINIMIEGVHLLFSLNINSMDKKLVSIMSQKIQHFLIKTYITKLLPPICDNKIFALLQIDIWSH